MPSKPISTPSAHCQQASKPMHMLVQPHVRLANARLLHGPHRNMPAKPNKLPKMPAIRHGMRTTAPKHLPKQPPKHKNRLLPRQNVQAKSIPAPNKHPPQPKKRKTLP
jgi:hypothetical protein